MTIKKLHIIEDLCSGCRLCEMACSFLNTKEYNPRKSRIRIVKVEKEGINMPIADCDGISCAKSSLDEIPKCVEICPTGALIFAGPSEAAKMKQELITKRALQPLFKLIAPWKWPYPWRPWPFEEMG